MNHIVVDHMTFPRSVEEMLGAIDRLRCIYSCPETREEAYERAIYYSSLVFLWPVRNLLKDRHWEQYNLRDVYIRTTPEPKALIQRKGEKRLSSGGVETRQLSPLLDLPREVRNAIWGYAVAKMQVHWRIQDRKLRGTACRSDEELCQSRCMFWIQKKGDAAFPAIGVMGILMSCRQIYSETFIYLYSCNTFDTVETDVIAFLPRLLLPERLKAIRYLRFLWTVYSPPSQPSPLQQRLPPKRFEKAKKRGHYYGKTWNLVWKNLAEMEGLVDLRVEMNMLWARSHQWEAEEFDCLMWVHRPRKFHLVVLDRLAQKLVGKTGTCMVESIELEQK